MRYLIAFISFVLAGASAAQAQTSAFVGPFQRNLSVQGQGLVERAPDIARLSLQIVTDDPNATTSASKNNAIYNTLKARLGGIGIGADSVHTTGFDVSFYPQPPANLPADQRRDRYGYVTTRSLQVNIAPLENVGKAIDAATAAGVTDVGGVSYDLKDRRSAYAAALAAAMADAKRSADALAAAGPFTLGAFISVEAGSDDGIRPGPMMMKAAIAGGPVATDLGPGGPIQVRASVTVKYAIR
jgi:uncharacterized protein